MLRICIMPFRITTNIYKTNKIYYVFFKERQIKKSTAAVSEYFFFNLVKPWFFIDKDQY
jgi:hypothetical protein